MKTSISEKFRIVIIFFVLLIAAVYLYWFEELYPRNENTPKVSYEGVINFRDASLITLKGNRYSVMKTLAEEYEKDALVEFRPISMLTSEQTAELYATGQNTDIMRYRVGQYTVPLSLAISDEETAQRLCEAYLPAFGEYYKSKYSSSLVVGYCFDIYLIAVNLDIASALKVNCPGLEPTAEEFAEFLSELDKSDTNNKYFTLGLFEGMTEYILPFDRCGDGEGYRKKITGYAEGEFTCEEDILYSFFNGETAVIVTDLKNVNYLMRHNREGNTLELGLMMFPVNEKTVFVSDTVDYIFISSENELKNEALCDFAEYLISPSAQSYTQNTGLLPITQAMPDYDAGSYLKDIFEYCKSASFVF